MNTYKISIIGCRRLNGAMTGRNVFILPLTFMLERVVTAHQTEHPRQKEGVFFLRSVSEITHAAAV